MTNSDIVREMLKMQKKLDVAIFEKAGMNEYPKPEQYFLAILDEVGELNHEMKPKWCWWKANAVINLAIWLKTMNNGEQILNDALKIIEEETGKSKVQA